jgi:hypothetical protein
VTDPLPKPVIVLTRTYTVEEAVALCEVTEGVIRHALDAGHLTADRPGKGPVPLQIDGIELFKWLRAYRRGRIAQPPSSRLVDRRGSPT